ncbi:type II toxin-antitoxin system VapC family toxin [Streptomyces muensis]|uniref:Ribonuclease VapC n=1 Tax=Streptomyces muensis TaxID=1077944 RepID=A0A9X1Q582_STRM4|nr:PIN domain-containing protein [Streptomyces muensis]MCF1599370.1 PIN domain-containing protein [Streptomyces muensis]
MTAPVHLAVADTSILLAAFNRRDQRHQDGIDAFGTARILVLSPLVLAELDYLLHQQASEKEAVEAVCRLRALVSAGYARVPAVDAKLLGEAEKIQRDYMGQAIGLTDAVNACLAWRLQLPTVLSFDNHYRVIAPRRSGERPLDVRP